jgi:hypothetical protein
VDIDNVNLISGWNPIVDHGSVENFSALFHWMETADLSDADNYAYVSTQMDLDNFVDYQIFELFSENTDWPANNMRCWQLGNGKWRWIFFDDDACLRWSTFYAFENSVDEGHAVWPSNWRATLFFRRLLENETFKERFENRFHELLDTAFSYEVTKPIFDNIKEAIIDEVPLQSERFGFPTSMEAWNTDMGRVNWFLMNRGRDILEPLHEFLMDLHELQQEPMLCYPNPSTGEIHINLEADVAGVTEIRIFDLMGREVFAMPCRLTEDNNTITFDPNLRAGFYILRIGSKAINIVKQ